MREGKKGRGGGRGESERGEEGEGEGESERGEEGEGGE